MHKTSLDAGIQKDPRGVWRSGRGFLLFSHRSSTQDGGPKVGQPTGEPQNAVVLRSMHFCGSVQELINPSLQRTSSTAPATAAVELRRMVDPICTGWIFASENCFSSSQVQPPSGPTMSHVS